jgi:hypothetical protein
MRSFLLRRVYALRYAPLLALGTAPACKDEEPTSCELMCDELVKTCEYDAFPDWDSCVEGCLYDEDNGARIDKELECVTDAACDTFAIVDCQHEFGPKAE